MKNQSYGDRSATEYPFFWYNSFMKLIEIMYFKLKEMGVFEFLGFIFSVALFSYSGMMGLYFLWQLTLK